MRELFNIDLNDFPVIIAEIGLNHEGSLDKAKKLIKLAKKGNADAVKFQFYTPDKYVSTSDQNRYNQISKFSLSAQFILILSHKLQFWGNIRPHIICKF